MKKTNKILAIMLASSMFLAACDNQATNNETTSNKTETTETEKDTKKEDKSNNKESKEAEKLPDDAVALVNGETLTKDQYKDEMSFYASYLASSQGAKNQVVGMMVKDKLTFDDAQKNGIEVSDKEVSDQFMQTVDNIEKQNGKGAFDEMLEDYNMTADQFKDVIKKDILYTKHQEWFLKNNPVSDEDVDKFYEENKDEFKKADADHILVDDEKTAKEVKEKLEASGIVAYGDLDKIVEKVAVCGGAGSSLIEDAINKTCDLIITGDVKYHEGMDMSNKGIIIADVGHFASENHIIFKLAREIEQITGEEVYTFSKTDSFRHFI